MSLSDQPSTDERAELELLRDLSARVIGFGGDDYTVAPWIDMHRLHAERPYIGCPFCRPEFLSRGEIGQILKDTSRHFAGDYVNAGVVVGEVRRRLADSAASGKERER